MPSPSLPTVDANPATILLVDDDEYVHVAVIAALGPLRLSFVRARSAGEAMQLARRHRPDLAIVDLGLPDRDGYALSRELRAMPELGTMPIVILTGHLPDPAAARAAGADRVIAKPFRLNEFVRTIAEHLGERVPAS